MRRPFPRDQVRPRTRLMARPDFKTMKERAALGATALALVILLCWTLVPPFPRPKTLMGDTLSALTTHFGPPTIQKPESPMPSSSLATVWERPRGLAIWSLRAEWKGHASNTPAFMSLCFRMKWASPESSICCESAILARFAAFNSVPQS
jgi:hypothetical protein